MSTRALVVLEDLRREEAERAGRELAQLRRRHAQASAAEQAAVAAEALAVGELQAARHAFAGARTVFALRAAEGVLCVANNALARARHRREQTRFGLLQAERALVHGEARLRAAELARRSVARTLEQRAADVSLRVERRLEDESDEAFRGQFQRYEGRTRGHAVAPHAQAHGVLASPARGPRGGARAGSD